MTIVSSVHAGQTSSGGTVSSGYEQDVFGQTSGVKVIGGGSQVVEPGGITTATLLSGSSLNLAKQIVSGGGTAISTTISSGGKQLVYGTATSATVSAGGYQDVKAGGTAANTVISSFGTQGIDVGGSANNTVVATGGMQYIGGIATNTTVTGSGVQYVSGAATNTTLTSGGEQLVVAGGSVTNTTFGSGGGIQGIASGAVVSGQIVTSLGEQIVIGSALSTTIAFDGTQLVSSGTASATIISSGGTQGLLSSGKAISSTIKSGGVLEIVSSSAIASGTVVENGGSIVLGYVPYVSGGTVTLNTATDVLSVTDGGKTYTEQLAGSYAGEYFHLSSLQGYLEITATGTPCYCLGTLIETEKGDVPVEQLAIGDRLMTASGVLRPIKWIGTRSYTGRFADSNRNTLPICFKAGSLYKNIPRRDLWVSPKHAMYIGGVLIPAECLVNGVSIIRVGHVEFVAYFHIELDSHDVIYAEGALSETFIDDDNRGQFRNAYEYAALYPAGSGAVQRYCAPRIEDGSILKLARNRIARRLPSPVERFFEMQRRKTAHGRDAYGSQTREKARRVI